MIVKTLPKASSRFIQTGLLKIDRAYQRTLRKAQVKKIVENYDPAAFGSLLVAQREDGDSYVVDGQQRLIAAKQLGIENVLCSVFESEGRSHEANIFKLVNNDRTGIPSLIVYRACIWAGDEETLAIDAVVRECGFRVPQGANRHWPNILCTGALYQTYRRKNGTTVLRETLATVKAAWDQEPDALKRFVISGIALFIHRTPAFDCDRLISALKSVNPSHLLSDTESARKLIGGSRDDVFARGILRIYNKRLRTKKIKWDD